LRFPFL